MKKRADLLLVEKKLSETRSKAQAMIMAGQISINGKKITKSGEKFLSNSIIEVSNLHPQWVSRGSLKLLSTLEFFKIKVENFICMDLGASTGGFTEVLLKNGAKKIYSVDVGTNQMHERLKKEKKIINIEKTNARYINDKLICEKIDLIVCDVSFISMKKVIEPCLEFLQKESGIIIGLIKPQYEAMRKEIQKGGIVKDSSVHKRICDDFQDWFKQKCKMQIIGLIESPIKGQKGNIEFLIVAQFKSNSS